MYKNYLEKRIDALEEIIKNYDYYRRLFSEGSLSAIEARLKECEKLYDLYLKVLANKVEDFEGFEEN